MDARSLVSTRALAGSRLLLIDSRGGASRLTFQPDCLGDAGYQGELQLLSPDGFVCDGRRALLRRSGNAPDCAMLTLELLDARGLAELLRTEPVLPRLAQVEVRGRPQRAFAGSHEYCFAERHARSWSEDSEGLVVTMQRGRSGGNRRYRVVLAEACPDLWRWCSIGFRSGANNGVICGNAGDAVMEELEFDPSSVPGFALAQQPS